MVTPGAGHPPNDATGVKDKEIKVSLFARDRLVFLESKN